MPNASLRALLLPLVTLFGCGLFDEEPALVQLSAIAAPAARTGESVVVRVIIENRSDVAIMYQGNLCWRFFRVTSASGEPFGPANQKTACPAIDTPIELASGKQHEFLGTWLAGVRWNDFEPISVHPGRYLIEPEMAVRRSAGGRDVRVSIITTVITVVE